MSFVPERLDASARRRLERAFFACVAVAVVVGLLLPSGSPALAQSAASTLLNYVLIVLASVLNWVISAVGYLILQTVDAIISVAQYNSFTTSRPVEAGWPLVRDVVNMLFIVVLLVTAVSTIIQYKRFDYKKILPKLLLMAVLVNFSKTLIGLLIDFSQVLMLTFVNGFKAAAPGNFIDMFKLQDILSLAKKQQEAGNITQAAGQDAVLLQILFAEMLAAFMVMITLSMTLIILIYLIARVVGLWVALIISPLALFATALSDAHLSGLSAFSEDFWKKMGAMASGGPTMAFFLWLTLATVQQGGFGEVAKGNLAATETPAIVASGIVPVAHAQLSENNTVIQYFRSEAGTTEALATFFVAIVMLGMGVNMAVQTTTVVSEGAGKLAGRTRDYGSRAAHLLAHRWATAPAMGAARASVRATRWTGAQVLGGAAALGTAGARAAESRLNIVGGVGQGVQWLGRKTRITPLAAAGGKMRGRSDAQMEAYQKTIESELGGMGDKERLAALDREAGAINLDRQKAGQLLRAKHLLSKEGGKALKKEFEEEGKALGFEGMELEGYAQEQTNRVISARLAELKDLAEKTGNKELKDFHKEKAESRPDLIRGEKFGTHMDDMINKGPREFKRLVSPDALKDARVRNKLFAETDILRADGDWNKDSEWYKQMVQNGGSGSAMMKEHYERLSTAPNGVRDITRAHEAAVRGEGAGIEAAPEGKGRAFIPQSTLDMMVNRSEGRASGVTMPPSTVTASGQQGAQNIAAARQRRQQNIDDARQRITGLRAAGQPQTPQARQDIRDAQWNAMMAGAKVSEAYNWKNGRFGNAEDRENFRSNVARAVAEGATDAETYNNLDLEELRANAHGKNEARTAFADTADLNAIRTAWERSAPGGPAASEAAHARIQHAVGLIHAEGERVQEVIAAHNARNPATALGPQAIDEIIASAQANDQQRFAAATTNIRGQITMEEARVLDKSRQIVRDNTMRAFRRQPSSQTRRATQRVRRPAATPGSESTGTTSTYVPPIPNPPPPPQPPAANNPPPPANNPPPAPPPPPPPPAAPPVP